jgi:hypothetical protein
MDVTLQAAIVKIMDKLTPEFYGTISLSIQAGKVHVVKTEQTEKISPLVDSVRP